MPVEIKHQEENGSQLVSLSGTLDGASATTLIKAVRALLRHKQPVMVELKNVTDATHVGVAALAECLAIANKLNVPFRARNASGSVRQALDNAVEPAKPTRAERKGLLENIGESTLGVWRGTFGFLQLLADTAYWGLLAPFRRQFPPPGSVTSQAVHIGMNALPIVSLISFLLGLIMAFQAAHQLRQFGATIFVANLVGISIVRELGPLMTAIIVAGRSGSAIAAELGTMVVGEEIDALRVMGIEPIRYLVIPRVYAITFTQPALTVYANAVGIFGGFLIGVLYLGLSPAAYISQTISALSLADVSMGMAKSLVFSWVIVLIGCHSGLRITGGAVGVGRATTTSVVSSIFTIIVVDSIFTTLSTLL